MRIEHIEIDIHKEQFALIGQCGNRTRDQTDITCFATSDPLDMVRPNQVILGLVNIPHPHQQHSLARDPGGKIGSIAPPGSGQSANHGQWHSGQNSAVAGFRCVEIPMGINPDHPEASGCSIRLLYPRDHTDAGRIVAGNDQHWLPSRPGLRHKSGC